MPRNDFFFFWYVMIEEMAEYVWSREAMNKNYMRNTVYHLIIAIFFRHEGGF